ncbi:unnamed protein product [Gadus morhua 'NCC']
MAPSLSSECPSSLGHMAGCRQRVVRSEGGAPGHGAVMTAGAADGPPPDTNPICRLSGLSPLRSKTAE